MAGKSRLIRVVGYSEVVAAAKRGHISMHRLLSDAGGFGFLIFS
jgi:hypothetical protein